MALHDIHSCSKIAAENLDLRQKIKLLTEKREALQQECAILIKKLDNGSCLKCSKSCKHHDIGVQTEAKPLSTRSPSYPRRQANRETTDSDILKINKVIEMHSHLLKRYDKEVQLNMNYADTISDLNVRLSECEKKLREMKDKNFRLERDLIIWKGRRKGQLSENSISDDMVLHDVVKERNKLAKENKEMRRELKSLDASFFDEIEDVKFALKQSVELNKKYEKSLQKLCHQFGIPFSPEII